MASSSGLFSVKYQALIRTSNDVWIIGPLRKTLPFLVSRYHLLNANYRKTSNISRTLAGNKMIDNSDVVGASPVGAAPTTSSFLT